MMPPRLAEWLIRRSTPAIDRVAVLGDLSEEFETLANEQGLARAKRWYWRQAITSLIPNIRRRLTNQPPAAENRSGGTFMDAFWQDLRFGWRAMRKRPTVTSVAVLSLTIGISMSAVVFSLLDGAVLSLLPVHAPKELGLVLNRRGPDSINHNFSYPDFHDYRRGQQAFVDLVAYSRSDVTIRQPSGAAMASAELVSGGFFSTLGIRMRAGRGLTEADDTPQAPPVVVVSESLWRTIAPGATSFEPQPIKINDRDFTIVGIADSRFHGMTIGANVRLWAAIHQQPIIEPAGGEPFVVRPGVSWLSVMGRLEPGVTRELAAEDLNRVERALIAQSPRPEQRTLLVMPGAQGDSSLPASTKAPLQILFAAALLVLVVACANVANLLVARAADRNREIALRAALGASRGRISRLLLVEAMLLGLAGSTLGLLLAQWMAHLAVPFITDFGQPVSLDVGLNWRLAGFVLVSGLGATLIAGLVLVFGFSLSGFRTAALADGGRAASASASTARVRQALVAVQFALSLALVMSAVLLVRTLDNLRRIPTGLDVDRVALLEVSPEAAQFTPDRMRQYYADASTRLRGVPGVQNAAYGRVIPLGFGGGRVTMAVPGYTPKPDEDMELNYNVVSPAYFETLGITLLDGRLPDDTDVLGRPVAAVVNDTMARRYWPDGRAVGREMKFGGDTGPIFQVVGVVRDVKYRMLREEAGPSFYYSVLQSQRPRNGVMHVRTSGDPSRMLETLRRTLAEVDPAVPVMTARTLRTQLLLNVNNERVAMTIGLVLALSALLLAAVGLYGAMSYSVTQRTREIGVRLALGAVPRHLRQTVLGQGLRLVLIGGALGIGLGIWLGRLVESRLYGVRPGDPLSFVVSGGVLTVVALIACWAPARRAMKVDPVVALRQD